MSESKSNGAGRHESLDAVVIGTGVAGLYQLHKLRDEQGLKVKAVDTATGVGGTWYWNRYPGARFDSEAYIYQYLFSEELYKGWSWSERFPGQPEIEKWLNYVADKLDLRKDIRFSTTITSAVFNEATQRWTLTTDKGGTIDAQFLITCCGMLSAPLTSVFPGQDTFKGTLVHTGRYPKQKLDLAGKRVAVVGNGATGIQVIQTIAGEVGSLKVFVRTPQYIIPMKNPKYGPKEVEAYKARFEEFRKTLPHSFTGFEYDFTNGNWKDLTADQRHAVLEKIWDEGSLRLWLASFVEMFFEEDVSEEISEFVRKKMRARLKDPKLCEALIPTDYGFGTHRVPLETNYLEAFHQPNVELVSVRNNPIKRITPHGIELTDGTSYGLDVIILATGFDAGSGALTRIDIRGRGGRSLKDEWSRDIRTTMGLQVHGYPNMFTTGAPLAPSTALCNMTTCLQQQVEWISDCIAYLKKNHLSVIEPTKETQDAWVAHHDEIANTTLVTKTHSWYMGSNVEGKPRRLLSYIGGVGTYRQKCDEVASSAYLGFAKQ
ncbi:NAD(P)/FAD-dependent oxidoreductase [Bradyrhizobium sp. CCGUVB23]|uniref:flavin-containing monooxygenase n=1 Tax=Bradyrhizobium sp. CCGUVB23 TaxID=2949630 RepID=UPI0020B17929|nr:NAD(P)/FAD-dependent oxidoreductase [Bradyrhizobium sp. CCGUVB23]MCP3459079.1 NAD(P)/FAD-dependent oxidoreductase [Bradyrhizobium sp. CCGUVB23]